MKRVGRYIDRCFDIRLISPGLAGGGSQRVCLRLANHWAQEGKQVELLLTCKEGVFRNSLDPRVIVRAARTRRVRWALPWLIKELWRRPSVPALAFGPDVGAALGLLKRLRLVHTPTIYREWNLPEVSVPASSRWVYHVAIAHLDGAIAQTNFAAASLRRLGVDNIPILRVANPVDMPREITNRAARSYPSSSAPIRILSVGRLSTQKRYDRLLRALASWRQKGYDFRLKIAGDGELRSDLEKLAISLGIAEKVSFLGWVDNLAPLYFEADLFVLCSAFEGMPNALLEAILSGCRALSSGGAGVRELLGEIGLSNCYLEESDFRENFRSRALAVLALPSNQWRESQQNLAAMTDMQAVAARYFDFCWAVANRTAAIRQR